MYFAWGKNLYYIADVAEEGELFLIEDCKTEDLRWIRKGILNGAKVVVNKC